MRTAKRQHQVRKEKSTWLTFCTRQDEERDMGSLPHSSRWQQRRNTLYLSLSLFLRVMNLHMVTSTPSHRSVLFLFTSFCPDISKTRALLFWNRPTITPVACPCRPGTGPWSQKLRPENVSTILHFLASFLTCFAAAVSIARKRLGRTQPTTNYWRMATYCIVWVGLGEVNWIPVWLGESP